MSTPNPHAASQNLRARAEHRHLLAATLPTDMPADTQRLVQELQIHQLELEMQNEELLLAQADAEHSRAQYVDLYDFAPVGYCMLAANGILTQLNQQTGKLLGYTRQQLVGRRLALFVAPDEREAFADFLDQLAAAPDQRLTCELAMCRSDETPLFAQFEGVAILATPEHPLAYRLVLLDVTARHLATAELATNEARFRAAFEQSRDGVLLLDDQRIVDANDAAMWLLRLPHRRQVIGRHLAEFWPEYQPDGRRSQDVLSHCLSQAKAEGWCRLEWAHHDSVGQLLWDEMAFSPVMVQGQPLMHVVWRDITTLKHAQQVKLDQQQQLAQAVLAAEESEKRRIAESLHNGLGQLLYAAKLGLDQLRQARPEHEANELKQAQQKVSQLLASAIAQTRTLAHELVPRTLEDFGLEAAIQDICTDYSIAPLRMQCHIAGLPAGLPTHLALAAYRMAQELANNIVKHAQATQASLHLTADGTHLRLRATDNGVGFADEPQSQTKGLGWQALQDRVRLLNGTLQLSAAEPGTCITICLPLAV